MVSKDGKTGYLFKRLKTKRCIYLFYYIRGENSRHLFTERKEVSTGFGVDTLE